MKEETLWLYETVIYALTYSLWWFKKLDRKLFIHKKVFTFIRQSPIVVFQIDNQAAVPVWNNLK